ncbi:Uncharacterised protein [Mycobacteroides abscessus subsp. abscessus]|nr:Uncharacterised protein [Mycobacteroides abscessus subsp. abscessus]
MPTDPPQQNAQSTAHRADPTMCAVIDTRVVSESLPGQCYVEPPKPRSQSPATTSPSNSERDRSSSRVTTSATSAPTTTSVATAEPV